MIHAVYIDYFMEIKWKSPIIRNQWRKIQYTMWQNVYVEQNGFARLRHDFTMYILAQSLLERMMIELDYNDWCWVCVLEMNNDPTRESFIWVIVDKYSCVSELMVKPNKSYPLIRENIMISVLTFLHELHVLK